MDIQEQIFQRLLADGNPLILEPFQARGLVATGRPAAPAAPNASTVQAHIAMRLRKRGVRPIKMGGRWIFPLVEIARWMAAGGDGAPTEPSTRPGAGRWGKVGRPSNSERAARAAAAR